MIKTDSGVNVDYDSDENELPSKLRFYLSQNQLSFQTKADDLLTSLDTTELKEWFDYCSSLYRETEKKRYYQAMKRITNIAKQRRLTIEANSLPVGKYVELMTQLKLEWPIAARPNYWE